MPFAAPGHSPGSLPRLLGAVPGDFQPLPMVAASEDEVLLSF